MAGCFWNNWDGSTCSLNHRLSSRPAATSSARNGPRRTAARAWCESPSIRKTCWARFGAAWARRPDGFDHARYFSAMLLHAASLAEQLAKLVEQIRAVVRPRRGFGVILHAEQRQAFVAHSFQRPVVEVDV